MHMFEYTSQVIAHQREDEILRAAEQRRVALERLAPEASVPGRAAARDDRALHRSLRPGATVRALGHALRAHRAHRPESVPRGTMAR